MHLLMEHDEKLSRKITLIMVQTASAFLSPERLNLCSKFTHFLLAQIFVSMLV